MKPRLFNLLGLIFLLLMATGASAAPGAEPAVTNNDLEQYQGQVVLLDFWASWCGPCRRSFPWMNIMRAKYARQGLVVVAVNLDQKRQDAQTFLQRYPAEFTIWFDPDGELAQRYEVSAMPTSVLLDRNGQVITQHRGFLTKRTEAYEQAIRAAL